MKLTQRSLTEIKALATKQGKSDITKWDLALPGFGLRYRNDKLSLCFQYRFAGKDYRVKIGDTTTMSADEARKRAVALKGQVHDAAQGRGVHPAHERDRIKEEAKPKPPAASFGSIIPDYLSRRSNLRDSSMEETRRYLEKHWQALHSIAPSEITLSDVAVELNRIEKDSGPAAANRARSTLSKFFKWAVGEGISQSNPVTATNKREENGSRERTLSDAEIVTLWQSAGDNDYGKILRLILLTGCRREEIGGLKWSEIDLEARTITLPPERTKNGCTHIVPLSAAAVEILTACERDGEFVFGRTKAKGFSGWSQSKTEFNAIVGLDPWTLHDLRRTVRTGLSRLKVLPHVAEAVVNHLPAKLVRTYDLHTYEAEKRDALDRRAHHLQVETAKASGANVTGLAKS